MFLDPTPTPAGIDAAPPAAPPAAVSPPDRGQGAPPFTRPPWRASDLLLGVAGLLGALVLAVAFIGIVVAVGDLDGGGRDLAGVVATIGFEASMAGVVLLLARRRGVGLRELGFRRPTSWMLLPAAWLGAYAVLGLYGGLLALLDAIGLDVSGLDEGNPLPIDADEGVLTVALLGAAVVVAAPFGEEIFFRGLMFRGLRGYWRALPALAISGLLFGVFHLNLSVLLPFTAIGMVFAWAMERSRSLWTSIAAHAAFNSLAFGLHVSGVGS